MEWARDHAAEIAALTGQHLWMVALAVVAAALAGLPLGIVSARRPRLGRFLLRVADVIQTIPSLALFGILIPMPLVGGIGARTAIIALFLYSLLPIMRSTVVGIRGVDPLVREAGLALGMTPLQLLQQVELPLALPSILGGFRIATVVGIGIATIAAAVGGGGLGTFIFRGVAMVDHRLILAGAIPAALLALVADLIFGTWERAVARRRGESGS